MSDTKERSDQVSRIRAAVRKDGDHGREHTRAQLDVELKRERERVLAAVQKAVEDEYADGPSIIHTSALSFIDSIIAKLLRGEP